MTGTDLGLVDALVVAGVQARALVDGLDGKETLVIDNDGNPHAMVGFPVARTH